MDKGEEGCPGPTRGFYFQLATSFHSDRGNIISPVAEVAPHGRGRPGGGANQRVPRG